MPIKKIIHVNQHVIRKNKKTGVMEAPITVKTYKSNDYAYSVEVEGRVTFIYSPDKPLSCGAHLWAETTGKVTINDRYQSKRVIE